MESSRHIEVIDERGHALLAVAAPVLDQPVPACPGWAVVDLVGHIGSAWGWAADTVATGQRSEFPLPPDGIGPEAVRTWSHAQLTAALEAMRAADPDADCWTFGLPRSVAFWMRRQALESALHAHDTEEAAGAVTPIDPEVARDGVDEFLTVMLPRWVKQHPEGWSGETYHLHRTDGEGEWLVRLGPDGDVDTQRTHAKGDVALRGPAEALWLFITGRADAGHAQTLEVLGEASLVERWAATIKF
jgi:uncharacterized protein (TIGR03083 family)